MIEKLNNKTSLIHTDIGVYAVSTGYTNDDIQTLVGSSGGDWEAHAQNICGCKIVPYGINNELPTLIRQIMDDNSLAPGILEREIGLLYGDGPQVYTSEINGSEVVRSWKSAPEVWQWLNTWNFRRYLQMSIVEYKYMKGLFVKYHLTKGRRVNKGSITKLEIIPSISARLGYVDSRNFADLKYIHVGDWDNHCRGGVKTYNVFNKNNPWKHGVSVDYHNTYSFARNFYSVPGYYGALKWIMRSSDIPDIIKYMTDNSISVAYHIHSPSAYWDALKDNFTTAEPDKTEQYYQTKVDEAKDKIFAQMSDVLAGKKNVGKFIETVDFVDSYTNTIQSWKIEPIDQKIKAFIETQIKISDKSDSATTSGMGLHPSLSNIILNGQLSSGSQMLYALKLYLASDVAISEEVIFEAINIALDLNFPNKGYRMGFYRKIINTEDSVSPEKRTKNVI